MNPMAKTIVSAFMMITTAAAVQAQTEFRVETDLFLGDEKEPFHQTTTLFSGGVAYDLPHGQNVVTMVDPKRNRIVLLDKQRRKQTNIDIDDLTKLIENAKTGATGILGQVIADAQLVEVAEDSLTVGQSLLRYEATLQPSSGECAAEYAAFANASAMLNGGRDPAALPYARLLLNEAILQKNKLPKEITKTVMLTKVPQVSRSILHANFRLSKDDQLSINEIGTMLASFEKIPQREFFNPASPVAASK